MKHYYYMGKPIRAAHYKMLSESSPPFKNTLFIQDDKDVRRGTCSICGCTMTNHVCLRNTEPAAGLMMKRLSAVGASDGC